ncbi:MAG TPA: FGLLP motif-containing membrane protein, partial [Candidatus Dormibacteraeota bacterium]|nr:FGLLP motif-containing membrane protein [Candidatus Dormibacteraeota bacterium]
MARLKLVLATAWAGACFLSAAGAGLAATSPSPSHLGDSCLLGRWVATKVTAPGNWTWNGEVTAVSGAAGLALTFRDDGVQIIDLTASKPLVGDYHGHQLQIQLRGNVAYHAHADGHSIVLSAPAIDVQVAFIYDGVLQPGGTVGYATDAVNTYTCTATRLRIESQPGHPGYGPEIDELERAAGAAAGGSGSLVSTVGSTLPSPATLLAAPAALLVNALITLALVLLVTFPSHLFNRTYEENHEVIRYLWERRFAWLRRLRWRAVAGGAQPARDAFSFAVVAIGGGVLASMLDPRFGLNLRTAALFAGAVFALAAGSLASAIAAGVYRVARGKPGPWHLHALPSGLLVAAMCVLLSRITNFQPGYLYGLIGGVVFARELSSREEGHVVAVTSVVTLAVAFASWLAWVPISSLSLAHPDNFGWALASNFLAALFVSGMVGLLIGLVPLRFLPGEKLAGWHRGAWGAVFGLAALSVVEVMLRPQSAGAHVATVPFWTTAGLFVGFGTASIL